MADPCDRALDQLLEHLIAVRSLDPNDPAVQRGRAIGEALGRVANRSMERIYIEATAQEMPHHAP